MPNDEHGVECLRRSNAKLVQRFIDAINDS
jgi:hypothetical protein